MSYLQKLRGLVPGVVDTLKRKGIHERYLHFGGPGAEPVRKPTIPTEARSEFLANRAMGDWAEHIIAEGLRTACPEWKAIPYGDADRMAAGESGFREFYLARLEDVRHYGKRPDLVIFPVTAQVPSDLSQESFLSADAFLAQAVAAIEVRSSKFEALRYMQMRTREREEGKKAGRLSPSFTVKVEDLIIVFRWIERYGLPEAYFQVFFDCAFGINFCKILELLSKGEGFTIEKPEKSQEKATIMIPVTGGVQLGLLSTPPTYTVHERVTRLGRHDAYVAPTGGILQLDPEKVREVLAI